MVGTSPVTKNVLVEQIVNEFLPRFVPNGVVRYVAGGNWARQNPELIEDLGLTPMSRHRMPDVLIHEPSFKRLVLIDASTRQGVMTKARRDELTHMYSGSHIELVFVTTFPNRDAMSNFIEDINRDAMSNFIEDIAWEAEVWVADAPDHLIHFNGDRFLGPYPSH